MDGSHSVNIFVIGKPGTGKTKLVHKAKSIGALMTETKTIKAPRLEIFDVDASNERQILELLNDAYVNDTVPNVHNGELHGVILTSRADSIDPLIGPLFHAIKELLGHRFPLVLFFAHADVASKSDLESIKQLSFADAVPEPIEMADIYYSTHPDDIGEFRAAITTIMDRVINKRMTKK